MTVPSTKSARLRKLEALSSASRLALYGNALEAWKSSLEQVEIEHGATPTQARLNVRVRHETALKQGYPAVVKAERDAFMDRHVAAAIA